MGTVIAPVNRIIPFSAVDGPGNRTVVFLQGCNIDCKYCHNPETRALCIHCGRCVPKCPTGALSLVDGRVQYDPAKCVACDTCIKTCAHDASPRVLWMTVEEVLNEIKKQMPFIRGITVSGGECMLYPEFLAALFSECKMLGLHTLIDSNGMVDFRVYPELLAVTDGVMLDIKAYSKKDHVAVTGFENESVLKNAAFLAEKGKLYEIRTVVVRELFDPVKVIESIAAYLCFYTDIGKLRYKLIAYRPFGVREQYQTYESPDVSYMEQLRNIAIQVGFQEVIII